MLTKSDIERFYLGEKQVALYFAMGCVIIAIAAVVFYFLNKQSFFRGISVTAFLLTAFLAISTFNVYKKSDEQRVAAVYAFDMNPSFLKEKELPKLSTAINGFNRLLIIQLVVIALGVGLFFYFKQNVAQDFWRGMAVVFIIGGAILFITDFVLKNRAVGYKNKIEQFVQERLG